MNYIYLGDKLTDKKYKNKKCWAVLKPNGKCIRGKSKMLVEFNDNKKQLVIAYRLRKIKSNELYT